MKKKLTDKLTLFYTNNFPIKVKGTSKKKFLVSIGIGGNIGDTKKIFNKLFLCFKQDTRFDLIMTSPLLLNPAFGFLEQNDFLNGIILLRTNLAPNDFFKNMQRLEKRFKRTHSFKDAPRTLDIDIIFFHDKKIHTKKLIIPHKSWFERDSVVILLQSMSLLRIKK